MIAALACLLAAIAFLSAVNTRTSTWSYSRLIDQALQGRVKTFEIDGDVGIATGLDPRVRRRGGRLRRFPGDSGAPEGSALPARPACHGPFDLLRLQAGPRPGQSAADVRTQPGEAGRGHT